MFFEIRSFAALGSRNPRKRNAPIYVSPDRKSVTEENTMEGRLSVFWTYIKRINIPKSWLRPDNSSSRCPTLTCPLQASLVGQAMLQSDAKCAIIQRFWYLEKETRPICQILNGYKVILMIEVGNRTHKRRIIFCQDLRTSVLPHNWKSRDWILDNIVSRN